MERMLCCSRISWKVWCSQRQKTCMPSSFKGGFRSSIHNLKVHEVDPSAAWWGLVHCMSGGCACFTAFLCQQLLSCESPIKISKLYKSPPSNPKPKHTNLPQLHRSRCLSHKFLQAWPAPCACRGRLLQGLSHPGGAFGTVGAVRWGAVLWTVAMGRSCRRWDMEPVEKIIKESRVWLGDLDISAFNENSKTKKKSCDCVSSHCEMSWPAFSKWFPGPADPVLDAAQRNLQPPSLIPDASALIDDQIDLDQSCGHRNGLAPSSPQLREKADLSCRVNLVDHVQSLPDHCKKDHWKRSKRHLRTEQRISKGHTSFWGWRIKCNTWSWLALCQFWVFIFVCLQ